MWINKNWYFKSTDQIDAPKKQHKQFVRIYYKQDITFLTLKTAQ